jgi:hypothetical protein
MAFKSGRSGNPTGRPKGAKNKAGKDLRILISNFLEQRFDKMIKDFDKLEPKDRLKVYTDLLQYGLPKLQAVSNEFNFEKLSEEELDKIIQQLMNHSQKIK